MSALNGSASLEEAVELFLALLLFLATLTLSSISANSAACSFSARAIRLSLSSSSAASAFFSSLSSKIEDLRFAPLGFGTLLLSVTAFSAESRAYFFSFPVDARACLSIVRRLEPTFSLASFLPLPALWSLSLFFPLPAFAFFFSMGLAGAPGGGCAAGLGSSGAAAGALGGSSAPAGAGAAADSIGFGLGIDGAAELDFEEEALPDDDRLGWARPAGLPPREDPGPRPAAGAGRAPPACMAPRAL